MSATVRGFNPSTVYDASEGARFAADATLVVVACSVCGVTYAIPASFDRSARKYRGDTANGWKICCPFGHTWWYVGETEKARLKRERDNARNALHATRELLRHEERSHAATRGHVTRKRKELARVKAGVCPCCNRTFQNLGRHMASQHPEFKP